MTWRTPRLGVLLGLYALAGIAGYGLTLGDFFLSDDFESLARVVRAEHWSEASAPSELFAGRWIRPLPMWSWYLNHQWFGLDPLGYRAFNLAVHVLDALLVAWLVTVLLDHRAAGAFAGAAFVLLPNHPEAVTWVCGRYDLLCATGTLASLLAWTRYLCPGGRPVHLALAAAGTAWALLSKEMALSLPLLQLAIALVFFRPLPRRARAGFGVLAAVVALYLGYRLYRMGGVGGMTADGRAVVAHVAPRRLAFLGDALASAFAPRNRLLYGHPLHPLGALPLASLAVGFVASARSEGGRRVWRAAWPALVLFALSLVPIAGWAGIGKDNQSTRFLYLPTAFSCAALAAALLGVRPGRWRLGAAVAAVALATWLAGLVLENRGWHEAARRAERIVTSFPAHGPEAPPLVVVTGLPDNHHGAHLFRNAFPLAIGLFTDYPGRVRKVGATEWERERERAGRGSAFYRWDGAAEAWRAD